MKIDMKKVLVFECNFHSLETVKKNHINIENGLILLYFSVDVAVSL